MKFLSVVMSLCFLLLLIPAEAQNQEELHQNEEIQAVNPCFAVLPMVRAASDGELNWQPGWPLQIPQDGFSVKFGKAVSIQLKTDKETFICEWDRDGHLIQFPLLMKENLVMASAVFNKTGEIKKITISGGPTIEIEIMETRDGEPALARINQGGKYFFAVFHYWGNYVSETWYTAEGSAQGLLILEYIQVNKNTLILMEESVSGNNKESRITYNYDSWGNLSGVNDLARTISVLYNQNSRPRYVEKTFQNKDPSLNMENESPGMVKENFTFQWDERDLLVSLKGSLEPDVAEKRYEYSFDARGNWTERREINMLRQGSYLFPYPGLIIVRDITYSAP